MDQRTAVCAGAPTADLWDQAYRRVDAYLAALGVRRAVLRHRLAQRMMRGATEAVREGPAAPVETAVAQMREEIVTWMSNFVMLPESDGEEAFLQSRLALLLADMPGQWHTLFLSEPPLPEAFAAGLRERLKSVPRFCPGRMEVHPLDLGLVPHLAEAALHRLERTPILRLIVVWGSFISLFGLLFYFTR